MKPTKTVKGTGLRKSNRRGEFGPSMISIWKYPSETPLYCHTATCCPGAGSVGSWFTLHTNSEELFQLLHPSDQQSHCLCLLSPLNAGLIIVLYGFGSSLSQAEKLVIQQGKTLVKPDKLKETCYPGSPGVLGSGLKCQEWAQFSSLVLASSLESSSPTPS
jgi:hypothetical protein